MEIPELGPNEFWAFALPYCISSDDSAIFNTGAFAAHDRKQIPLCDNHAVPIGVAELFDSPEGVWIRGRICSFMLLGAAFLKRLHRDIRAFDLCLSHQREPGDAKPLTHDGRTYYLVERGTPREVSFVVCGALPNTRVERLGPLSLEPTPWDYAFGQEGYTIQRALKNLAYMRSYLESCAVGVKGEYSDESTWLESVRI